ncbi:thialysine N-epsilon-acetyltransferase-like [Ylistrum balloti]|uniref:thialysine N-epsilon-acetyltransferase-like n=1 Tax=Ylistrum balloti TaxID=509963 RepID=UPI002905DC1A|nr:thialysine N-epsilon-acetyltransferase-like [Ylistrum balloti]
MSQFNIREAREQDVDNIFRMLKELAAYLKEPDAVKSTPETLRRDLQLYKCLVVEDLSNGESSTKPLIGYAAYSDKFTMCDGRLTVLDNLFVAPEKRGKGIGTRLLDMVSKDAAANGCNGIEILAHGWNSRAMAFYKKRGAIDVTENKDWHYVQIPLKSQTKMDN